MLISDILVSPLCFGEAIKNPQGNAAKAIQLARSKCIRLWLSVGVASVYRSMASTSEAFMELASVCQWLSSLPGDVDIFSADPIPKMMASGLFRLGKNASILGRNDGDMTPEALIAIDHAPKPLAFIDLASQQDRIRSSIEERIHRVLHHGQYIMGPEIAELEEKLAAYVGVTHCLTAASGTATLEIALRALEIGPGDEVITTPFTWISTAETIVQVGAKPVFVDIEPEYFNINVDLIEAAITPRTKAIMPVSLFGQMPDYERINLIATNYHLPVIEDGAQSFGAMQRGRRSCGVTTIGSTSFFPAKPLGCYGDGGALFTNDDTLAARMKAIRTHGGEKRHYHPFIGMNGRMDTVQAAVVLAKLESWDWEVEQRGRLGKYYTQALSTNVSNLKTNQSSNVITPPAVALDNTHVYAQYTVRASDREKIMEKLKEAEIPHAIYYPKCLHEQPCFSHSGFTLGDFPEAERASREVISLPMFPDMNETQVSLIVKALKSD